MGAASAAEEAAVDDAADEVAADDTAEEAASDSAAEDAAAEDAAGTSDSTAELSDGWADDVAGAAALPAQPATRAHTHKVITTRRSFFADMAFTSWLIVSL